MSTQPDLALLTATVGSAHGVLHKLATFVRTIMSLHVACATVDMGGWIGGQAEYVMIPYGESFPLHTFFFWNQSLAKKWHLDGPHMKCNTQQLQLSMFTSNTKD